MRSSQSSCMRYPRHSYPSEEDLHGSSAIAFFHSLDTGNRRGCHSLAAGAILRRDRATGSLSLAHRVAPAPGRACPFFWCNGLFTFVGKGTLAPIDAPIFLVRAGPYHWIRNPMYVAVLTIILSEA